MAPRVRRHGNERVDEEGLDSAKSNHETPKIANRRQIFLVTDSHNVVANRDLLT